MNRVILHLRPAVGKQIVSQHALCGVAPSAGGYAEITTTEYLMLHEPRQHVRGVICMRCADQFRAEIRAHAARLAGSEG